MYISNRHRWDLLSFYCTPITWKHTPKGRTFKWHLFGRSHPANPRTWPSKCELILAPFVACCGKNASHQKTPFFLLQILYFLHLMDESHTLICLRKDWNGMEAIKCSTCSLSSSVRKGSMRAAHLSLYSSKRTFSGVQQSFPILATEFILYDSTPLQFILANRNWIAAAIVAVCAILRAYLTKHKARFYLILWARGVPSNKQQQQVNDALARGCVECGFIWLGEHVICTFWFLWSIVGEWGNNKNTNSLAHTHRLPEAISINDNILASVVISGVNKSYHYWCRVQHFLAAIGLICLYSQTIKSVTVPFHQLFYIPELHNGPFRQ